MAKKQKFDLSFNFGANRKSSSKKSKGGKKGRGKPKGGGS